MESMLFGVFFPIFRQTTSKVDSLPTDVLGIYLETDSVAWKMTPFMNYQIPRGVQPPGSNLDESGGGWQDSGLDVAVF